jgi:hypothetical protein
VKIPYRGFPTDFRMPGQRVVTFWLDMWVERNAEVDRIKVEPQLYLESLRDWVVYPMEVRIQQPVVPDQKVTIGALPPVTDPADAVVFPAVQAALCAAPPRPPSAPDPAGSVTGRRLMWRNVAQHMKLIADRTAAQAAFGKASEMSLSAWCARPSTPPAGPEWYLRFRDLIFRQAGAGD